MCFCVGEQQLARKGSQASHNNRNFSVIPFTTLIEESTSYLPTSRLLVPDIPVSNRSTPSLLAPESMALNPLATQDTVANVRTPPLSRYHNVSPPSPQGVGSVLPHPDHQSRRQSYRPEPILDGLSKIKYLEPGCEACYIMTDTGRMEEMKWNPQWRYEVIVPDIDVTETEDKYKDKDKKIRKRKIITSPGWIAILT